ncbi:hypothetical protein AJ80_08584 [Polytolypa hystricis UAMH7299]|uniref:Uncharacterized protein n=1 Tax=Polytolypa hystricis (strain UAMH7299) TaxID=1447883 RepID=A0A2B7X5W4_POLH7|nr:hypothetical protein AJ80_08584 [Polytolypa hystricis UAMH7299]
MQTPARRSTLADSSAHSTNRTPRFIFASSAPNSTPQFAAIPRFLLSQEPQRAAAAVDDDDDVDFDVDVSDQGDNELMFTPPRPRSGERRRPFDAVEVFSDGELVSGDESLHEVAEEGCSQSNEDYDVTGMDVDEADADLLFPVSPSHRKRKRRLFSDSNSQLPRSSRAESISSTESRSPSLAEPESTAAEVSQADFAPGDSFSSPAATQQHTTLSAPSTHAFKSTPASSKHHPRFLLHNPPTSTRPRPPLFSTRPPPSTPLRKPQFILPISPSRAPPPRAENTSPQTISALSPSFRRTAARSNNNNNNTSALSNCLPNGAAAEVRRWILEMGARKQISNHATTRFTTGEDGESATSRHHIITGEVTSTRSSSSSTTSLIKHARTGHAAPFTLAELEPMTDIMGGGAAAASRHQKVLLFNQPLSRPPLGASQALNAGDNIGLRRGLVWEMQLSTVGHSTYMGESEEGPRDDGVEKWTVGVEWDILSQT